MMQSLNDIARILLYVLVAGFFAATIGSLVHAAACYAIDHIRPGRHPRDSHGRAILIFIVALAFILFFAALLLNFIPGEAL